MKRHVSITNNAIDHKGVVVTIHRDDNCKMYTPGKIVTNTVLSFYLVKNHPKCCTHVDYLGVSFWFDDDK